MDESQVENDYFYNVLAGILTETGDYIGTRAEKAILKEFWKLQADRDALVEYIKAHQVAVHWFGVSPDRIEFEEAEEEMKKAWLEISEAARKEIEAGE
jgi:hypothetical protein